MAFGLFRRFLFSYWEEGDRTGKRRTLTDVVMGAALFAFCFFCASPCWCIIGVSETQRRFQVTAEPTKISMSQLISMQELPQEYVEVGPHWAVFNNGVVEYSTKKDEVIRIEADTTVDAFYYPIVGADEAYAVEMNDLAQRYNGVESIPADEVLTLYSPRVIVQSNQYATMGDVPKGAFVRRESIHGFVKRQESKRFPHSEIAIEEVTGPPPWWRILLEFAGGFVCVGVSIAILVSTVFSYLSWVKNKPKRRKKLIPCPHCAAPWRPDESGQCTNCGNPWVKGDNSGGFPEIKT